MSPTRPPEAQQPSRYGPDDQIGMLNEISAAKVAQAAALVKQGNLESSTSISQRFQDAVFVSAWTPPPIKPTAAAQTRGQRDGARTGSTGL